MPFIFVVQSILSLSKSFVKDSFSVLVLIKSNPPDIFFLLKKKKM